MEGRYVSWSLWMNILGVKTLFIDPGSPWENGYVESFIGKPRIFTSQVVQ